MAHSLHRAAHNWKHSHNWTMAYPYYTPLPDIISTHPAKTGGDRDRRMDRGRDRDGPRNQGLETDTAYMKDRTKDRQATYRRDRDLDRGGDRNIGRTSYKNDNSLMDRHKDRGDTRMNNNTERDGQRDRSALRRKLAKYHINCEVKTFFAWGHLKECKTTNTCNVPSIQVIKREQMIQDFERRRHTAPAGLSYKAFYSKLRD